MSTFPFFFLVVYAEIIDICCCSCVYGTFTEISWILLFTTMGVAITWYILQVLLLYLFIFFCVLLSDSHARISKLWAPAHLSKSHLPHALIRCCLYRHLILHFILIVNGCQKNRQTGKYIQMKNIDDFWSDLSKSSQSSCP